jgi:hypothetical protein
MDDKLPASTDFSQGQNSYGKIANTFVNKDGSKTHLEDTRNLSPIPMRPIGFGMRDKSGKDVPTESIQNILRRTGGNVGGELKPNQEKLLRERKLIELGEAAEDAGLELENDEHGKTLVIPDDMFDDPEKLQKIKDRLFPVAQFIHLNKHWQTLFPKMNVIDASERATYVNPINGAIDALMWLLEAPETGDETVEQIESKLKSLQMMLTAFEEVVQKNTVPEKKSPELTMSPEEIQNLFSALSEVSARITSLESTLGANFTLRRFHADIIKTQENTLLDLKQKIETDPQEKDITAFEVTLNNLIKFLPSAEEEAQIFIDEENQLASVAPPVSTPTVSPVTPVAPEPHVTTPHLSRTPTTIEAVNIIFEKNVWLIQRNGVKERMKSDEFLAWQPIVATLRDYKRFYESVLAKDPSYDLSSLSAIKDAVIDAVEKEDFALADSKARELGDAWHEEEESFNAKQVVTPVTSAPAPVPTISSPITPSPDTLSPEEKKKQGLVFDVWKRWPGSIVISGNNKDSKGKLIPGSADFLNGGSRGETINLPNYEAWVEIKKRFDTCYSLYETFLKNGETTQKIVSNEDLIRTKNEVITLLLTKDLKGAFAKLEEFEILMNQAPEIWKLSEDERKDAKLKIEEQKNKERALSVIFTKQKSRHVELFKASEKIFIELDSPLEKKIIVDKLKSLNEQEQGISTMLTNHDEKCAESIEHYERSLNYLSDLIEGIDRRLKGMGPVRVTLSDPKTSPFELRREGGVEKLHAKEDLKLYQDNETRDTKKIQAREEILNLHRKLFNENTERYLNHYFSKPLLRDDPNREAFEAVIAQYREQLEREIAVCAAEIDDLEKAIVESTSDAVKYEKNIKLLHARENKKKVEDNLRYIQNKESEGTSFRKKIHNDVQTRLITSSNRQAYSPEHDASVADMGRTRSDLTFTGRREYDKAQRERKDRMAQEGSEVPPAPRTGLIVDGDVLKVQGDDLRSALMSRTSELHTEDDIKKNKPHQTGMTGVTTPYNTHASPLDTQPIQAIEEPKTEPIFTDETGAPTPEIITSQEYKEKRHQAVGRLAKILEDNRVKRIGKSWKALALATLATIAGGKFIGDAIGNPGTPTTTMSSPARTLGEAVSWQDHLNPSQKEFLVDLAGTDKLSFLKLTEKYAKPYFPNGPSGIGNFKMMEPTVILNSNDDSVYGMRDQAEREGVSKLIVKFAEIIRASNVNNRYVPNLQEKISPNELNEIVSQYTTMEQLYLATVQVATQANK